MNDLVFEYHPAAVSEATEAYQYYAKESSDLAERFLEELIRARKWATRSPRLWPQYLHGTRCALFRRFPFGLIYIERNNRIIGIAVAHMKRRPGYWQDRID